MKRLRKTDERSHFDHGWLDTYHMFSFADYYDPAQMGFRALRVINEDRVAPGMGFGMHPHRDMEIVTYVLAGALAHKDSMGNGSVLKAGELQRMSAGSGLRHSEFNPSDREPVHLYQIWLLPRAKGTEPSYEQKAFDEAERRNRWQLVASPDAADGSLSIGQDARLYLATLDAGRSLDREIAAGRHIWLQLLRGAADVGGTRMNAGDGLAISDESRLAIATDSGAEVLLFDLA